MEKRTLNAVAYCRLNHAPSGQRIIEQERACLAEINKRGFNHIKTYSEIGPSLCASLDELLEDAWNKRFDVIIVTSLNRLSRKVQDLVPLMSELEEWGIEISLAEI